MMTEDFDLEFHKDHLCITPGTNNASNSKDTRFWETLAEACASHNCRRMLCEVEIFPNEMTYTEAYFVTRLIAENIPAVKIACFVDGHVSTDLAEFVELTAANRGISIGFFSNRNEAIDWLNGSRKACST